MGVTLPELYEKDDAEYVGNNPYAEAGVTSHIMSEQEIEEEAISEN